MSVKPEVHERYRKRAAQLSTARQRVSIAELVEFLSKYLPQINLEEITQAINE